MPLPRRAEILPMPGETNTSHTGRLCEKTLQEHPRFCKASGGNTRGCASTPPWNSTTSRREEHPISKHQPLRDPNGYHRKGSGATVRDSHRGPLNNRGKPHFLLQITKHKHKTCSRRSRPSGRGPQTWRPQRPTRTVSPSPPRAKLRFARGIRHHADKTLPRSMAERPLGQDSTSLEGWTTLGRDSASLEGWTAPRARLRLARGPHGLAAPYLLPQLEHLML
jgi:hypothetical protein